MQIYSLKRVVAICIIYLVASYFFPELVFAKSEAPISSGEFSSGQKQFIDPQEIQLLYDLDILALKAEFDKLSLEQAMQRCGILGVIALSQRNSKKASDYFNLAKEYADKEGSLEGKISALASLAIVADMEDDLQKAINYTNEAIEIYQKNKMDNRNIEISLLMQLGDIQYRQGKFKDSQGSYEKVYNLIKISTVDRKILAECQLGLGYAYYKLAIKNEQAKEYLNSAIEIFRREGIFSKAAEAMKCLGNIESDIGKAISISQEALALYKQIGDDHGQANCNFNLGIRYKDTKNFAKAIEYFDNALYFYSRSGSTVGIGISHLMLGEVYTLTEQYNEAKLSLKQALFLLEKSQAGDRIAQAEEAFGDLYDKLKDTTKAQEYYQKVIKRYQDLGLVNNANRVQKKIDDLCE